MKKILVLLILFASAMTVWPSPVSSGKAEQWALKFLQGVNPSRGANIILDMVWDGEDNESRANTAPSFYVFNRTDSKGFVVVAGDDAVNPLIGYSFENNFNYTNLPANIIAWFKNVKKEIEIVRNSSSFLNVDAAWQTKTSVGSEVLTLETALWNQGDPYNLFCPMDPVVNERSVTGCSATALAIVMRGYSWPAKGKGSISGYSYTINEQEKTLEERSVAHHYDWNNMPLVLNENTTQEQKEKIANLMFDCGMMARSAYSKGGTGGNPDAALQFLRDNFSYDPSIKTVKSYNYTNREWVELMKKELTENGQVLYGGFTSSNAGHAFVLHGYTTTDYFLVNWGWGGLNNGYFRLSQLDPDSQGIGGSADGKGFNYGQDAVVNFKKKIVDLGDLTIYSQPNNWGLKSTTNQINSNENVQIEDLLIVNWNPQTYQGEIAYCLFDSNNNLKETISKPVSFDGLAQNSARGSGELNTTIPSSAKKGDYIAIGEKKQEAATFIPIKGQLNSIYKLEIGSFDHALTGDLVSLVADNRYSETPYGLHTSIDKIEKNVNFTLTADQVKNITAGPVTCQIGVGVYSKDHTFKSLISEKQTDMNNDQQNPMLSNLTFNCCISNDIIPGDYISLCYSTDNGSTWKRVRALDNIKAHITLLETNDVLANTTIEYNKTDGMITVENVLADEYYELKNAQGVTVQEGLGDKAFVIDTKKFAAARYVLWIYLSKGAKEHMELELTFGQK